MDILKFATLAGYPDKDKSNLHNHKSVDNFLVAN